MRLSSIFLIMLMIGHAAANAQTVTSTVEGVVIPARSWDVSAEINNKIKRLHFIEGQIVSKGDLLVEFDTAFKKLELDLAEAQLAKAATALDEAREVLSRQEELREKDAVSEATYRASLFAARMAVAEHRALKVKRDMAAAILQVQKLHAPFDGQMSAPRYRENANVNIEHSREVATIVQLDPIHVRAPVPLKRVLFRLQSGRSQTEIAAAITVTLELPNGTTYSHTGRIVSASFGLDQTSQEAAIIVEFPNPDQILRPGMNVVVTGYEN